MGKIDVDPERSRPIWQALPVSSGGRVVTARISDATSVALDRRASVYFRLNRLDEALADFGAALEQRAA